MKIRAHEKISPINLKAGDKIVLEDCTGSSPKVVLAEKVGRTMIIDEAVIFDVEEGDFGKDVKDGVGGAFLSTKRKI